MDLREGAVVAQKYRLDGWIGRGGMGSVWRATQLDLERRCAIKFIEGEFATDVEAQERFKREALAAASVKSPNIVDVYEYGIWETFPFIAMELLEGEDLGARIARGRLSLDKTCAIMSQVCRGLQKVHAAGIVHRDLKPENIFIVHDDEHEIVKVVDFGVAKLAASRFAEKKTRAGEMLGTPSYMSPEQGMGTKGVDARSDLWSLAIITFECLTGRLPFDAESLAEMLAKLMVAPIPLPSTFVPGLPASMDEWFQHAAERDPDRRFQTARDFSDALSAAVGSAGANAPTADSGRAAAPSATSGRATLGSAETLFEGSAAPSGLVSPYSSFIEHGLGADPLTPLSGIGLMPGRQATANTGLRPGLQSTYGRQRGGSWGRFLVYAGVLAVAGGGGAWLLLGKPGKKGDLPNFSELFATESSELSRRAGTDSSSTDAGADAQTEPPASPSASHGKPEASSGPRRRKKP